MTVKASCNKLSTCAFAQASLRLLALILFAAPAFPGNWTKDADQYVPSFPPQTDHCLGGTGLITGYARATARSTGQDTFGQGRAWDASLNCDVRVQNVAVGAIIETWRYQGEGEGWARVFGHVSGQGEVVLLEEHCAAAAVGYAEMKATFFDEAIKAVVKESAAETTATGLGDISFSLELAGISVSVSVSTGLGVYPDEDQDIDQGEGCTNLVEVKRKGRAQIEMFADESFFATSKADCSGYIQGTATREVTLSNCNVQPPPPPK